MQSIDEQKLALKKQQEALRQQLEKINAAVVAEIKLHFKYCKFCPVCQKPFGTDSNKKVYDKRECYLLVNRDRTKVRNTKRVKIDKRWVVPK